MADTIDKETMLFRYNEYIKYFDKCDELKIKNIELQNKIVLTISAALFGIIMTSVDKIMPLISSTACLKYLFFGLIFFNALVIGSVLASIHCANKGINIAIKKAEKYYLNIGEMKENKKMKEDKYSKMATKLRFLCTILICIIMAIFVIIVTGILFSKDYNMDKNKSEKLSLCLESFTAPGIPRSFYDSKIQNQIKVDVNSNGINMQQTSNNQTSNNQTSK